MRYKCLGLNEPALHVKVNRHADPTNEMTAHTGIVVELILLQDFFDRAAHVSDPFSKNFRRLDHRIATTYAAIVFFEMIELV